MKELFHIHTFRCGHAEQVSDEDYIRKAIDMQAKRIVFTDHAPFPNNPFGNRMTYEELDEYIASLHNLKEKYSKIIEVQIGLEIEYLPSYSEYYQELHNRRELDLLMLGQHFYEMRDGTWSFSYKRLPEHDVEGCVRAIIEGIQTGVFSVVAHPDRSFRIMEHWNTKCDKLSKEIISTARQYEVLLEQNFSSQLRKNCYRKEFWNLVPTENKVIQGIDAHCISVIEKYVRTNE